MKSIKMLASILVLMAGFAFAQTEIGLWTHSAGNPAEMEAITGWIDEFNAANPDYKIVIQSFPQKAYNEAVVAAALSKTLPCIIDIDGPNTPNWAWAGYLKPLDIPQETLDAMLDSTTGMWDGKVYAQGQFDAAVGILARKSDLEGLGIRIPTLDQPWTGEEFQAALDAYKNSGKFEYAFDPGMAWTGEWYPYGFSPFLQSFGGDLIDRSTYLTAEGALNGEAAVAWGNWW
jgi:multiple sugar transport system substrate-binding protein